MITSSQFRYSAALVPWSQSELQKLYTCWIRLHKAAWRLPNSKSFPNAQFYLPTTQGGRTITQPLVLQLQAIDIHIRSLSLWNDDIRMTAAMKIGEMFNKMKAASCEECALALAHKHQSQNSDVFGRFFALCDLLKVQAELPKNLLAHIPEWSSWTSLQVERAKASKEAKLSEEAMQGWHSDISVMCKEGYLSPSHLPFILNTAKI